MNRLEADVFPVIGHLPIDAVLTTHIWDIMLTIETRGTPPDTPDKHLRSRTATGIRAWPVCPIRTLRAQTEQGI
jgi:hypothetical protein